MIMYLPDPNNNMPDGLDEQFIDFIEGSDPADEQPETDEHYPDNDL